MKDEEIVTKIKDAYKDAEVFVENPNQDGYKIFIEVKSDAFKDLSRVKQHQAVMKIFQEELASGKMHAISLKTSAK